MDCGCAGRLISPSHRFAKVYIGWTQTKQARTADTSTHALGWWIPLIQQSGGAYSHRSSCIVYRYNQWAVDEIIQMLMCYAVTSMQCMSALVFALGETASGFDRASCSSLAHLSAKKCLYHTPLAGRPWATWSKSKDLRRCQPYSNWSQHYVQYHNPWWLPIVINHKVYTAVPPCDS